MHDQNDALSPSRFTRKCSVALSQDLHLRISPWCHEAGFQPTMSDNKFPCNLELNVAQTTPSCAFEICLRYPDNDFGSVRLQNHKKIISLTRTPCNQSRCRALPCRVKTTSTPCEGERKREPNTLLTAKLEANHEPSFYYFVFSSLLFSPLFGVSLGRGRRASSGITSTEHRE